MLKLFNKIYTVIAFCIILIIFSLRLLYLSRVAKQYFNLYNAILLFSIRHAESPAELIAILLRGKNLAIVWFAAKCVSMKIITKPTKIITKRVIKR